MDVRDLLRSSARSPRRVLDVRATTGEAITRSRRRQLKTRAGVVAGVLLAVSGGAIAAFAGDDGPGVEIAAANRVTNPSTGVSLDLPPGWTELPLVSRLFPSEVMVVGTMTRPAAEPIQACTGDEHQPPARSAFITIYEYGADDQLRSPDGFQLYTRESVRARPTDFGAVAPLQPGGDCPQLRMTDPSHEPSEVAPTTIPPDVPVVPDFESDSTTTTTPPTVAPPTVFVPPTFEISNHFREFLFVENNRTFLARIVTVDDVSKELLEQAYDVLDTFVVATPSVTTTTLYLGPPDQEAAVQQIEDAINAAFGTPSPTPSELSIEGGHPFADPAAAEKAAETAKRSDGLTRESYEAAQEGKLVATINWIVFDSPTYARLNFDVTNEGTPATANTTGYAVFEDGFWRLGRATFCEIAARGGVTCV